MLILAIDTALEACAACVLDTATSVTLAIESHLMARGHAEALMPLIDRVMRDSGIPYAKLDRIAVTTGPGSFTGLRVGLSAARGIALAAARPCVGVTTLGAFAASAVSESQPYPVISAIDARHDHVYLQVVSGNGEALIHPRIAPIADALDAARFGAPRLVGNAAQLLADRWRADAPTLVSIDNQPAPDIVWVAWLGAAADPAASPPRPTYLKPPDAKPQAASAIARAW